MWSLEPMTDESKCPNCGDECWEARGNWGCFERVPNQLVALTFQNEDENGRVVVERWSDMVNAADIGAPF